MENATEFAENLRNNVFSLWINPEIKKRKAIGTLPKPFSLWAAQVLLPSPLRGGQLQVKLNEEVRALVDLQSSKNCKASDLIYNSDVLEICSIRLLPEDANLAHVTYFEFNGRFRLFVDFRYDKETAKDHLATCEQFLQAARFSLTKDHLSAFVDNLFSAIELMAKAAMFLTPLSKNPLNSHSKIKKAYALFDYAGPGDSEFAKLLRKLEGLRNNARYLKGNLSLSQVEAAQFLDKAEETYGRLKIQVE